MIQRILHNVLKFFENICAVLCWSVIVFFSYIYAFCEIWIFLIVFVQNNFVLGCIEKIWLRVIVGSLFFPLLALLSFLFLVIVILRNLVKNLINLVTQWYNRLIFIFCDYLLSTSGICWYY